MSIMDKARSDKKTLVEEGTVFKGTLNSTCPVVVMGGVEGELQAPEVTIAASGSVVGKISATKIRSDGVLAGTVEADDVYLAGNVRSDTVIRARTLEVKLAPKRGKLEVTFGECQMDVGDEPSKDQHADPPRDHDAANGKADGWEVALDASTPQPLRAAEPEQDSETKKTAVGSL